MPRRVAYLSVLAALLFPAPASAQLRLPSIFSDHMVLQRGAPDPVWGWAAAGAQVTVRFAGQSYSTTSAADGRWMIRLDSPEASAEPRELSVQARTGDATETVRFQDVVVGEVWLMSGQSNMQMPFRGYPSQPVLRSNDDERMPDSAEVQRVGRSRCGVPPQELSMAPKGTSSTSSTVEEGAAVLEFDHAPDGLSSFGRELTSFTVAGEDKVFHPAEAVIVGGGNLRVSSEAVPNPTAVRYAWTNWIVGSLFNNAGLPASSFRTDRW